MLCSTCPPHSISTLTHALKHLAAAESNTTITPKQVTCPPSRFGVQNGCGPFQREEVIPKRVNQTCTEVVLRGWHGQRIWNSEKHSPTRGKIRGGQIRGATSRLRIWNSETQSPTRGQIRVAKSGQRMRNSATQSPALIILRTLKRKRLLGNMAHPARTAGAEERLSSRYRRNTDKTGDLASVWQGKGLQQGLCAKSRSLHSTVRRSVSQS